MTETKTPLKNTLKEDGSSRSHGGARRIDSRAPEKCEGNLNEGRARRTYLSAGRWPARGQGRLWRVLHNTGAAAVGLCARASRGAGTGFCSTTATSAMDIALERKIYELIARRLPSITLISVAHRESLAIITFVVSTCVGDRTGRSFRATERRRPPDDLSTSPGR